MLFVPTSNFCKAKTGLHELAYPVCIDNVFNIFFKDFAVDLKRHAGCSLHQPELVVIFLSHDGRERWTDVDLSDK